MRRPFGLSRRSLANRGGGGLRRDFGASEEAGCLVELGGGVRGAPGLLQSRGLSFGRDRRAIGTWPPASGRAAATAADLRLRHPRVRVVDRPAARLVAALGHDPFRVRIGR